MNFYTQRRERLSPRQLLALLTTALIGFGGNVPLLQAAPPGTAATPIQHLVIVFQENVSFDHYFGTYPYAAALPGVSPANAHALGRCGYGPRQPMLVISPWAKRNFVDHTVTDLTSPLRFIEDNWLGGQRIGQGSFDSIAGSIAQMFDFSGEAPENNLILDPSTGQPARGDGNDE